MSTPSRPGIWRSLWGSVAFRLTLNYGVLAVTTTLALLIFIHLQTVGALHGQVYRQTASRALYLSAQFEQGGRAAVVRAIDAALSEQLASEHDVYLYRDEHGERLAGNLESLFDVPMTNMSVPEARVMRDGREVTARLQGRLLDDGSFLIVGRDLDDVTDIRSLIGRASLAAVLVAFFLVACGTYIFRRELELRVGAIRRTAAQISAGQFKQRIPISNSNDEFSHLNRDINDMLDRVEGLMQGVRHVTDTIAHNLRTPLTRVLGRLRNAQRPGTSAEAVLEATRFAICEIENLTVLFDKLLQIAEIEAGAQRRNFTVVNLHRIASDVIDLYEPLADEHGLVLTLSSRRPGYVMGDADLLASAVANVVDNALKYAASAVMISIDAVGAANASITVRDDGPGIPDAEYDKIGTHFYRLDPDVTGYGLGLASVRAITRLHGGNLHFQHCRPGLKVVIELPAANI